ncbi:MAG TPA: hypothetical protein VMR14_03615 [Streptosporangiaceae bacterium]|nr:hypothetical protein [Streptosporangiaceae bacterium]
MTTMPANGASTQDPPARAAPAGHARDRRDSPVPTFGMIATRIMELRRRRGLMIAVVVVNVGLPALFLLIRLILHVFAPRTSPPAGGDMIFVVTTAGFLPTLGFITAIMVGCTAGSRDLTEGMFRLLVVTGRSRLALYLARIPAGLAILVSVVAISYTIVCAVSAFAAPAFVDDWNVNIPPGLTSVGFQNWARDHAKPVICSLAGGYVPPSADCGGPPSGSKSALTPAQPASPRMEALAVQIARRHYRGYAQIRRSPSISVMTRAGLWLELQTAVWFMIGLGLASVMGQRTGPVILLLVFQLIVTPIMSAITIPALQDLRRSVVGLAMTRLEPSGLPIATGVPGIAGGVGGPGAAQSVPAESAIVAVGVIIAWLAAWTILGAWRMMTRDA